MIQTLFQNVSQKKSSQNMKLDLQKTYFEGVYSLILDFLNDVHTALLISCSLIFIRFYLSYLCFLLFHKILQDKFISCSKQIRIYFMRKMKAKSPWVFFLQWQMKNLLEIKASRFSHHCLLFVKILQNLFYNYLLLYNTKFI